MRDTSKVQILQIRVCRRRLLGTSDRGPRLARLTQELSLLPPRRLAFLVFLDLLELARTVSFKLLGGESLVQSRHVGCVVLGVRVQYSGFGKLDRRQMNHARLGCDGATYPVIELNGFDNPLIGVQQCPNVFFVSDKLDVFND